MITGYLDRAQIANVMALNSGTITEKHKITLTWGFKASKLAKVTIGADEHSIYNQTFKIAFATSWAKEMFEKLSKYNRQMIEGLQLRATEDPMVQEAILTQDFETGLCVLALREYLTHYRNQVLIDAGVTAQNTALMGGTRESTNCSYLPIQRNGKVGGRWVESLLKKGFNLQQCTNALRCQLSSGHASGKLTNKKFIFIEGIVANTMMEEEMLEALDISKDQKKLWETGEILRPMSQITAVMEAHVAKCDKEASELIAQTLQNPEARQLAFTPEDFEGKGKEDEDPTFDLKPEHHAKLRKYIEDLKKGMEKEEGPISAFRKSWGFVDRDGEKILEQFIEDSCPCTARYKMFKDAAKAYELLDKAYLWAVGLANFKITDTIQYRAYYAGEVECFTVKEPLTLCENGVKTKEQFKSNLSTGFTLLYRDALKDSFDQCKACWSIGMHNMKCLNEAFAKVNAAA